MHKYVAVDFSRTNILFVADSLADLNKQILSMPGQKKVANQALWIYRMTAKELFVVQQKMLHSGKPFRLFTRPKDY